MLNRFLPASLCKVLHFRRHSLVRAPRFLNLADRCLELLLVDEVHIKGLHCGFACRCRCVWLALLLDAYFDAISAKIVQCKRFQVVFNQLLGKFTLVCTSRSLVLGCTHELVESSEHLVCIFLMLVNQEFQ